MSLQQDQTVAINSRSTVLHPIPPPTVTHGSGSIIVTPTHQPANLPAHILSWNASLAPPSAPSSCATHPAVGYGRIRLVRIAPRAPSCLPRSRAAAAGEGSPTAWKQRANYIRAVASPPRNDWPCWEKCGLLIWDERNVDPAWSSSEVDVTGAPRFDSTAVGLPEAFLDYLCTSLTITTSSKTGS